MAMTKRARRYFVLKYGTHDLLNRTYTYRGEIYTEAQLHGYKVKGNTITFATKPKKGSMLLCQYIDHDDVIKHAKEDNSTFDDMYKQRPIDNDLSNPRP